MDKNVATKVALFAFNTANNGMPKTGDGANLTAFVMKDYGALLSLANTTAIELDASNAPGYYLFNVSQAESNANHCLFTGKSSTANISIIGASIFTTPANFCNQAIDAAGTVTANLSTVALAANMSASFNTVNATLANVSTSAALSAANTAILAAVANAATGVALSSANTAILAAVANTASAAALANVAANVVLTATAANMSAGFNTVNLTLANVSTSTALANANTSILAAVANTASNASVSSANTAILAAVAAGNVVTDVASANGAILAAVASANSVAAVASANAAALAGLGAVFTIVANLPTAVDNADVWLDRDMGLGTDSGSDAVRTPRQALFALRNRVDTASGNLVVFKVDDSTMSWQGVLTSNATAAPITGVNPG